MQPDILRRVRAPQRVAMALLALIHVGSASAPCATAANVPGHSDPPTHAENTHASGAAAHSHCGKPEPDAFLKAHCACGCTKSQTSSRSGARLGFALARAVPEPGFPTLRLEAPSWEPPARQTPPSVTEPIPI